VTARSPHRTIGVWARAALGTALVAAAATAAFVALGPRHDTLDPPHALRTATARLDLAAQTGAWSVPLPRPAGPPVDPYAPVPVWQIGAISIPAIGLQSPVYEGIWLTVLDVGPGHWPGTAGFGAEGNVVIGGHRVTHGAPFRHLDRLVPGDDIVVSDTRGTYDYKVTASRVVDPEAMWIVDQHPGHALTLFACHPPGSYSFRYVVQAELVSARARSA
jgi:sortase A